MAWRTSREGLACTLAVDNALIVPANGLAGPSKVYFSNTEVAGILDPSGNKVLLRAPTPVASLSRAIFVGSMAPHNWFHWTIDNLSTIYMARYLPAQFDDYPFLIPDLVFQRPHWIEALSLVSEGREILPVPGDAWINIESLVRVEGVTRPNPRSLSAVYTARIGVFTEPLLSYRDYLLEKLGLTNCQVIPGRKLFLARRESEVRGYNQEEIFQLARAEGFERVHLDELNFCAAAKLFRESEFIIGPHGAAWAGLLFSHPSSKAMLWTWPDEREDNWYENLAYITGVNYLQIFTSQSPTSQLAGRDRRVSDYNLRADYFKDSLSTLLNL